MKINDQLLILVNARLRDLKFEIDTVGYLQNIEEDTEMSTDFAKIDISKSMEENFPQATIEVEVENEDGEIEVETQVQEIPYESRAMFTIKSIMKDMKVSNSNDIIKMVANRSSKELSTLQDLVSLYETVENDVKHVLQADMVINFLVSKGLDEQSQINVDFVKDEVLLNVMKILGINSEEL